MKKLGEKRRARALAEHWAYLTAETQDMCPVESQDIRLVETQDVCSSDLIGVLDERGMKKSKNTLHRSVTQVTKYCKK